MERRDVASIPDFSNDTLLALAERLESSNTFQELIIREVELDEVYRRVDAAVRQSEERDAQPGEDEMLKKVRDLVFAAHDLASQGHPLDAASRLRAAMTMEPRR
jgi:hypothetical protein